MTEGRTLLPSGILTPCGHVVSLWGPKYEGIELADIVYALARTHRFGGWWKTPMTVLNHTFLVYYLSQEVESEASLFLREEENAGQLLACYCLLHDAHEAYLGDQTRPMERLNKCNTRNDLKRAFDEQIFELAGLPAVPPRWIQEVVYRCDEWAARIEADRCLVRGVTGWPDAHKGVGPIPPRWWDRQRSIPPYKEWHFFDLWMEVATKQGREWAIRGLQRIKEVCPGLYLVDDDWLAKEIAKSTGFRNRCSI